MDHRVVTRAPAPSGEIAQLRAELRRCQAARMQAELRAHLLDNALLAAEAEHALCCRYTDFSPDDGGVA